MNKFAELIANNGSETLKRRATTIAQTAEIAQQNLVNELKTKSAELELKITNLTDLAPESTESLRPGTKDWDPKQWSQELQNAKQEKYFVDIQLKIASSTYDEFFVEKQ